MREQTPWLPLECLQKKLHSHTAQHITRADDNTVADPCTLVVVWRKFCMPGIRRVYQPQKRRPDCGEACLPYSRIRKYLLFQHKGHYISYDATLKTWHFTGGHLLFRQNSRRQATRPVARTRHWVEFSMSEHVRLECSCQMGYRKCESGRQSPSYFVACVLPGIRTTVANAA